MTIKTHIGLDSQCYTYLISALENLSEPTDTVSEEKKSLVRIFFYCSPSFWLSPKVINEYDKITDATKRQMHQSWHAGHFLDFNPVPDSDEVDILVNDLKKLHPRENDCIIAAEYQLYGISTILSYDGDLIKNLKNHSHLNIIRPSEYWNNANIPRGAIPITVPHKTNPLNTQSWWRW